MALRSNRLVGILGCPGGPLEALQPNAKRTSGRVRGCNGDNPDSKRGLRLRIGIFLRQICGCAR
jgi:hypothetical protein